MEELTKGGGGDLIGRIGRGGNSRMAKVRTHRNQLSDLQQK